MTDEPRRTPLRLHHQPSEDDSLEWAWLEAALGAAGTYWVVAPSDGQPHPRPVWGAWHQRVLFLSLGSPALRRALVPGAPATVHLDSGTDVVIVEGVVSPLPSSASGVDAYNEKYDWDYDVERYGPLTVVAPTTVMAWRAKGVAGRDGFGSTGRWTFTP